MVRRLRKTVNLYVTVIQIVENLRRSWFLLRNDAGDYLFEYHEDDPIWHFSPALFAVTSRVLYRARQQLQFQQEVAAYLAAKELASRQIHGYLTTGNMGRHDPQSRNYRRTYERYVTSQNTHPMYSEAEITNPWYIPGIGEWDQLYGDLSA